MTGQDRGVSGRDKFGLRVGSKVSKAVAMFERNRTMADVRKATGSNQYNVLRRLEMAGREVVRKDKAITVVVKGLFNDMQRC